MRVRVIVQPRSRSPGVEAQGDVLLVRVRSPPVGGRANEEARELIASYFGVKRSRVTLVAGAKSREKVFEVEGVD